MKVGTTGDTIAVQYNKTFAVQKIKRGVGLLNIRRISFWSLRKEHRTGPLYTVLTTHKPGIQLIWSEKLHVYSRGAKILC